MAVAEVKAYCTNLFDRKHELLRRTDKKGAAAAERAEKLICDIVNGDLSAEELLTKQTKNGEMRLHNCRKYDLGSGYRLISVRNKVGWCFIFIGTHDDCDRWLDKRREYGLILKTELLRSIKISRKQAATVDVPAELVQAEAEYEAYIASKLDDETIRYLFRGLREIY